MNMTQYQFILAAPRSNEGKTTITLGLLRLFQQKGIAVQPYKSGPDYIDPKFHQLACGRTGVNLDLFMMSQEEIEESLQQFSQDASIHCIEGVMGLFDGAYKSQRSTAELAKTLDTPIILVVDAKSVAYSVAPLLYGFKHFDQELNIAGVIFNRVGSERHYDFLKDACHDVDIEPLGYLPTIPEASIPSRHLGLNISDLEKHNRCIDLVATALDKTVNWQRLLALTERAPKNTQTSVNTQEKGLFRFAIAKDDAFNFIYPQHLQAMEAKGEVMYFSPLKDSVLPPCDFLYLPGGYPECYLEELSANTNMLQSIKTYTNTNGKAFAECGGMMYLGQQIIDSEGNTFPMVGHFDFTTSMEQAKLHLGYRQFQWQNSLLKGHEFHYSQISSDSTTERCGTLSNATGKSVDSHVYHKQKTLASYIHFYFGSAQKLDDLITKISEL